MKALQSSILAYIYVCTYKQRGCDFQCAVWHLACQNEAYILAWTVGEAKKNSQEGLLLDSNTFCLWWSWSSRETLFCFLHRIRIPMTNGHVRLGIAFLRQPTSSTTNTNPSIYISSRYVLYTLLGPCTLYIFHSQSSIFVSWGKNLILSKTFRLKGMIFSMRDVNC